MQPFIDGYADGETPNPCVRCNGSFRFDELLAFADRIGAARLATGHYARIVERDGRRLLARAADPRKDQSYMLAAVDEAALDRVWFPLGEQTKDETRAEAEAAGLAAAHRPESQEACFLGGDDYRDFLGRHGLAPAPGAVVDEAGRELGSARRLLALHARPAPRARHRGGRAALRARRRRGHEHRRRRPARLARPHGTSRCAAACARPRTASRRSSATARPRCPRR